MLMRTISLYWFKFKKNHRNNFQKANLDYFKDWKLGSMLLSQRESLSMPINVISNSLKIKIRDCIIENTDRTVIFEKI